MAISDVFAEMGAPLKNTRWSWGAVRPADDAVVLRVWQDETRSKAFRVTKHAVFADDLNNLGYQERLEHLRMIRDGCASFMIVCIAKDVMAIPRKIRGFNAGVVFVGGALSECEQGDSWLEYVGSKSIAIVKK